MSPELILVGSVVAALLVLGVGIFSTRRQQTLVDQRLGTLAAQNPYEPIIATEELEDERLARREATARSNDSRNTSTSSPCDGGSE